MSRPDPRGPRPSQRAPSEPDPPGDVVGPADLRVPLPLAERLALYEALLDTLGHALVVTALQYPGDGDPPIVYASRGFTERSGWLPEDVLGRPGRMLLGPQPDAEVLDRLGGALAEGRSSPQEVLTVYKDGSLHWSEVALTLLRDERGTVTHVAAVERDVTALRYAETERADREAFVQSVLASLPAQTAVLDGDGTIAAVNSAWDAFRQENGGVLPAPRDGTGGPEPNYVRVCEAVVAAAGPQARVAAKLLAGLCEVLDGRCAIFTLDYELEPTHRAAEERTSGHPGRSRWFQVQAVPLRGHPGGVVTHTDITYRKRTEEALVHQAGHDPLTGLLNRAGLLQLLAGELPPSPGSPVTLLFADLDGFKEVNDGLGHAAGDDVLVDVTARLQRIAGAATIARLGGDEFALVLPADRDAARTLAVRFIEALREPFDVAGLRLTVSASVGIAEADPTHRTPGDLLRDADAAMYEAKARGRDRYAVFDSELRARALRRVTMLHRLQYAVTHPDEGGLSLQYQPVISLTDRRVLGLEALARWTDETLGQVDPAEFIQVAEDSGLIVRFGAWALGRACLDAARCGLQVSVNVSARQLADARIVDVVEQALARSRLPAHRLCLELTESAVLADLDATLDRLGRLRRRGVQVALDDFGTGWSSLGQLRRLPVDRLKVDRSFVEALGRDAGATAVVSAIVALARGLGMRVTAEGVETEDQFCRLRDLGCDDAQGFRLGLPGPLPAFAEGTARYLPLPAPDAGPTRSGARIPPRRRC